MTDQHLFQLYTLWFFFKTMFPRPHGPGLWCKTLKLEANESVALLVITGFLLFKNLVEACTSLLPELSWSLSANQDTQKKKRKLRQALVTACCRKQKEKVKKKPKSDARHVHVFLEFHIPLHMPSDCRLYRTVPGSQGNKKMRCDCLAEATGNFPGYPGFGGTNETLL